MFSVPPMEHILKEELLLTHAQTSLLYSIPILMIGAVAIPAGVISDRIGVRKAAGIGAIMIAPIPAAFLTPILSAMRPAGIATTPIIRIGML